MTDHHRIGAGALNTHCVHPIATTTSSRSRNMVGDAGAAAAGGGRLFQSWSERPQHHRQHRANHSGGQPNRQPVAPFGVVALPTEATATSTVAATPRPVVLMMIPAANHPYPQLHQEYLQLPYQHLSPFPHHAGEGGGSLYQLPLQTVHPTQHHGSFAAAAADGTMQVMEGASAIYATSQQIATPSDPVSALLPPPPHHHHRLHRPNLLHQYQASSAGGYHVGSLAAHGRVEPSPFVVTPTATTTLPPLPAAAHHDQCSWQPPPPTHAGAAGQTTPHGNPVHAPGTPPIMARRGLPSSHHVPPSSSYTSNYGYRNGMLQNSTMQQQQQQQHQHQHQPQRSIVQRQQQQSSREVCGAPAASSLPPPVALHDAARKQQEQHSDSALVTTDKRLLHLPSSPPPQQTAESSREDHSSISPVPRSPSSTRQSLDKEDGESGKSDRPSSLTAIPPPHEAAAPDKESKSNKDGGTQQHRKSKTNMADPNHESGEKEEDTRATVACPPPPAQHPDHHHHRRPTAFIRTTRRSRKDLPADFEPTDKSVAIGRGRALASMPGNVRFSKIVDSFLPTYAQCTQKTDRTNVVCEILHLVYESCPEGAFIRQSADGRWYEVGDADARMKIGTTLRDRLPGRYRSSTSARIINRRTAREERKRREQKEEE